MSYQKTMRAIGMPLHHFPSPNQHPLTSILTTGIKNGRGNADALFVDEIPLPTPGARQALVKVKAFGLNRMDLLQREGQYPVPPQAPPTLGVEFSGTISELGEGATEDFKVGDEVFGLAYGGAYAEYIAVATGMLIHKPKELSWEEAAGVPEVCFAAWILFG
jgi:NADPH2:quinone reductase